MGIKYVVSVNGIKLIKKLLQTRKVTIINCCRNTKYKNTNNLEKQLPTTQIDDTREVKNVDLKHTDTD